MNHLPKVPPMVDQRVSAASDITPSISVSHLKANKSHMISFMDLSAMQVSSDLEKYFHSRHPTWITRSVEQDQMGKWKLCPYCIYAWDDLNIPITLCSYRPRYAIHKVIWVHTQGCLVKFGCLYRARHAIFMVVCRTIPMLCNVWALV